MYGALGGSVVNVGVDVVIHKHVAWCGDVFATNVQDSFVDAILCCNSELCLGAAQAALPLYAVKVLTVFYAECVVCEEVFCSDFDYTSEDLLASWTEVRAKSQTTL